MSKRTAVAAPPAEPWDDLFAVLDRMKVREIAWFVEKIRHRYRLVKPSDSA